MSLRGTPACLEPALITTKCVSKSEFCAQCFENELWDRCSLKKPCAKGAGGSASAVNRNFVTPPLEKTKITEIVFDIELRCVRYTLYKPDLWLYSVTPL